MLDNSHEQFMSRAIEVAKENPRNPFGTVIVDNASQVIVAEGINRSSDNPTLHGEIDAINNCAATGETNWEALTLYTTAEPCPMCMSAILWSGINSAVFGTSIPTLMELGWNQINIRAADVIAKSHRRDCQLISGLAEFECNALFLRAV